MSKTIYHITFLLIVFIHYPSAFAQTEHISWYDTDQGLPQNSIKEIVKDKYGFLWLATQNNLCRFDGNAFVNFNDVFSKNKNLNTFIRNRLEDSLFIFSNFNEDKYLVSNRKVKNIALSEGEKNATKEFVLKNSYFLYRINQNSDVHLNVKNGYYIINNDGVAFENNKKFQKINTPKYLETNPFHILIANDLLFLKNPVEKKYYKVTPQGLTIVKADEILFDQNNKIFWHQPNNQCLVYNNDSLYNVTFENNQLKARFVCEIPNFIDYNIVSIYFDEPSNNLYLGSLTKGFGVMRLKKFKVAKTNDKFLNNVYYAMLPIDSNSVLTPDGQVLTQDGVLKDFKFLHLKNYLFKIFLLKGYDQSYWMKRSSNLFQYDLSQNNEMSLKNVIDFNKNITGVFDLQGDVAIALDNDLNGDLGKNDFKYWLYLYEGYDFNTIKHRLKVEQPVHAILKTGDNTYLAGFYEGLYWLNTKSMKKQLVTGSANLNIKNIHKTANGHIWIFVKNKGLYLLKNNQLILMPLDQEDALKNPHTLLEDASNHLWISTNNGLFRVPESELLAYADNIKKKVNYYVYTKSDGFYTNEFNGGCSPCGAKLANGLFALPSMDGIVFFNPNEVPHLYPQNGIYVERVKIDETATVFFNKLITLNNDFFRATVYPDVPYYADHKNLYVEAFLEGKSSCWERVDLKKGYEITNLEHGKYQLKFRLLTSPNGHFNYKNISIVVQPLFYQTYWFYALMLLAGFLIFLFIHKMRLHYLESNNLKLAQEVNHKTRDLQLSLQNLEIIDNQLQKEVIQQKKLLGSISHDVATPLKYIHLISKKMADLTDEETGVNRDLILSLKNSSGEIINFIDSLKDYATIYNESSNQPFETFDLFGVIEEKINLFHEIIKSKSIVVLNDVPHPSMILTNKNMMKVILHNLIDNAIKYTPSGSIGFSFEQDQEAYYISITDTGVGMTDDIIRYYEDLQNIENEDKLKLQNFGMGLHMVVQLLSVINGYVTFEKNRPKGTIVKLELLKSKT